jgi:ankyrin repeat protein
MNLEQLRKQAKELVRAARAGDAQALARLGGREPILARAQLVLAREHGYSSWPALVAALEADADAFVLAATSNRRERAERMLAVRPEIDHDPWARLVLGRGWEGDPVEPGGPRGWAPLLYVCHSCFASAELARDLLERGVDPNVTFRNEYGDMSALYGAAGVVHDPELTRALLEAGASPDDNESLYHSVETEDTSCLRLLLEHGATIAGTYALPHALDYEHTLEHLRLLLEAGADPNEGPYVAHAVRRGRGPDFLRLLAQHGADLDRPGGETWRGDVPLRTHYQHAVIRGRDDQAAALAELAADSKVSEEDRALSAVAQGERPASPLPDLFDSDAQEIVILAALQGQLDVVLDAVGPNFRGVVGGSPEGPLLGHAAWVGDADIVRALLEAGADPNERTDAQFDTPLAIAALGSQYHRDPLPNLHAGPYPGVPARDYVAVAEQLVAAGNEIEPRFLDVAEGPLYEWLEERVS